ncbi:hypothetical protein TNCV_2790721 [Trichonephila clavipes]|nr:hypothetical protein TNCV_2790721 [Trichonephila clavipes]
MRQDTDVPKNAPETAQPDSSLEVHKNAQRTVPLHHSLEEKYMVYHVFTDQKVPNFILLIGDLETELRKTQPSRSCRGAIYPPQEQSKVVVYPRRTNHNSPIYRLNGGGVM